MTNKAKLGPLIVALCGCVICPIGLSNYNSGTDALLWQGLFYLGFSLIGIGTSLLLWLNRDELLKEKGAWKKAGLGVLFMLVGFAVLLNGVVMLMVVIVLYAPERAMNAVFAFVGNLLFILPLAVTFVRLGINLIRYRKRAPPLPAAEAVYDVAEENAP